MASHVVGPFLIASDPLEASAVTLLDETAEWTFDLLTTGEEGSLVFRLTSAPVVMFRKQATIVLESRNLIGDY